MPESFTISDEQLKKINKWLKKFKGRRPQGAIGGAFTYSFTPTSLGVIVRVKDSLTGKELDVSDYENW